MHTSINYSDLPVLANLLSYINALQKSHDDFFATTNNVARFPKIATTDWIAQITAHSANPKALAQIAIKRRETLLSYEYLRLKAEYHFSQVKSLRHLLLQAISGAYDFLEAKENFDHSARTTVAAKLSAAIQVYERHEPEFYWPLKNQGKSDCSKELLTCLVDAFCVLCGGGPKLAAGTSPRVSDVDGYAVNPVVSSEDVGENFSGCEMRRLFPVPFDHSDSFANIKLKQLVPAAKIFEDAILLLKGCAHSVTFLGPDEDRYANRLMAKVRGEEIEHEPADRTLADVIQEQKTVYLRHEQKRGDLAMQLSYVRRLRASLVVLLREVIEEMNVYFSKASDGSLTLQQLSPAVLVVCRAGMINCLFVDVLLRQSGRDLQEASEVWRKDETAGRRNQTLSEFLQNKRIQFKFNHN